ncbi:MAG TPA: glycosyltransferase family 4 protein [Coleofasciculaceae cyanobacterium]
MQIVQLNTWDIEGGAARAVYRLHQGLLQQGHQETLVCLSKKSKDPAVLEVAAEPIDCKTNGLSISLVQSDGIDAVRTPLSNTLFSFPYPGWDVSALPVVQAADLINLHWVTQFQSPATLKKLFALGKPVVWTLHDMCAFTGGCHYSAGCLKYEVDCASCPQLMHDSHGLAAAVLQDKLDLFAEARLTIVTPSRWMAECARRSRLFHNLRVEVIPNSLETDQFTPMDKSTAKQRFKIAPDTTTLLFGAFTAVEHRKGFAELLQATQQCLENPKFHALAAAGRLKLLCFGEPDPLLESLPIPVHSFGTIASDDMLREIYSAADVFVLPSLEDNLPNTMLEAMSCGTPVLAFDVGGIPDVVIPGKTGWLVPVGDIAQMSEAILQTVLNPEKHQVLGASCRQLVEKEYAISVQTERYLALYQDVVDQGTMAIAPSSSDIPAIAPLDLTLGSYTRAIFDTVVRPALETRLQQALTDLTSTHDQLQEKEGQLQQQHRHLQQQQEQLQQQQIQLQEKEEQLQQQHRHLQQQQEQLQQTGTELSQAYALTQTLKLQIDRQRSRFEKLRTEKKQLRSHLQQSEAHLESAQQEMAAMQSSKFWKARTVWQQLKRRVGLSQNE